MYSLRGAIWTFHGEREREMNEYSAATVPKIHQLLMLKLYILVVGNWYAVTSPVQICQL